MNEIGMRCPTCGAPTVAVGAYWASTQSGPDSYDLSCTGPECDWTGSTVKRPEQP